MEYHDEVLDFFEDLDQEKFMTWLARQSPLNQVEIIKEFKSILELAGTNVGDEALLKDLRELDEQADSYQEAYLDEKLAELNLDMAREAADEALARYAQQADEARAYVRECIELNTLNAAEAREVARNMIALEQQGGLYRPEEWAWLEG